MEILERTSEWLGARVVAAGVGYRVWAPKHWGMTVVVQRNGRVRDIPLSQDDRGYWIGFDPAGRAGDLYQFRPDDHGLLPDVASRFQPRGVHGPSECIDPSTYRWASEGWARPRWQGQTTYELHVGTFSQEGTFWGAIERLDHLCELGIEAIELMPVADFEGERNWGYDGVALYAPARCYGRPDDLRTLVDRAHQRGLAVVLDVVYNHVGPSGNYLAQYSGEYYHSSETTPWGRAYNLDTESSRPVRDFLVLNLAYWLDEYRFDGLRLDATHAMPDRSEHHLLEEMSAVAHARGAFLIAEDERNQVRLIRGPDDKGYSFDAQWADDFHHQVRVALTGTRESYFRAYGGTPGDLVSTLQHGWTYRGEPYAPWSNQARGSECDHLPTRAFVTCIENHDQVGNRARGERLERLVSPGQFRAASMLLCLAPYAPLIFMGQEWAASSPFLFFSDYSGELGRRISEGRRREFERHGADWGAEGFPDPEASDTFVQSKLLWTERTVGVHAGMLQLYRACLAEREGLARAGALERGQWNASVCGELVAIHYTHSAVQRLLLVGMNDGAVGTEAWPANLEPSNGWSWRVRLHSEEARFGGQVDVPLQELRAPSVRGPVGVWLELRTEGEDVTQ